MLRRRHLGRVSFPEANDLQHALLEGVDDYLLLMEHPPTYTRGIRAKPEHFLADDLPGEVYDADRGGDVTYHGPGQVVAWAVVSVADSPAAGREHVEKLEAATINAITHFDTEGRLGRVGLLEGYPGVWANLDAIPVKIAQVGVRTERNARGERRSLHGVAVNVDPNMEHFKAIVPCGIPDRPVSSLRRLGLNVTPLEFEEFFGEELDRHFGGPARVAKVDRSESTLSDERPLIRRLRKAGVDPEAGLSIRTRKPEWLRIEAHMGEEYTALRKLTDDLRLVTVCEEAGCPNIFECWESGTATFMVNGERCTRACGFCLVDTRKPFELDPTEPSRVAEAVVRLKLRHAVVTCVARDDLPDGGAQAIADTIVAIRAASPETSVEVLISDLKGSAFDLQRIIDVRPDVMNHNMETVARLQRAVRPSAGYARSLTVLARSVQQGLVTKSGMMVGLGESADEIEEVLADLANVGVQIATIGQYLRPTERHLPVQRFWEPAEFVRLKQVGESLGLSHVESSPLTRSSYHAKEALDEATPVTLSTRR
jgi:lipoyl synthase